MSITELLEKVGLENVTVQFLDNAIGTVKDGKIDNQVTFHTKAISAANVVHNNGRVGIVVWCEREAFKAATAK